MKEKNTGILNNEKWTKIIIESEDGEKKIAEITNELVIPADGYVIKLVPKYLD